MPRVGCYDCGVRDPKYERPRTPRSGWNHTVSVCKKCRDIWLKKHPELERKR